MQWHCIMFTARLVFFFFFLQKQRHSCIVNLTHSQPITQGSPTLTTTIWEWDVHVRIHSSLGKQSHPWNGPFIYNRGYGQGSLLATAIHEKFVANHYARGDDNFIHENSVLFIKQIYGMHAWNWLKYCYTNISNTKILQMKLS